MLQYICCSLWIPFNYPPFEKKGVVYCFASVGRPYGFRWLSWKPFITKSSYFTCRLAWLVLDDPYWFWGQMVKGQCHSVFSFHISQDDWSWLVDHPYRFLGHWVKGQGHSNHEYQNGFHLFSRKLLIVKFSYFPRWLVMTSKWLLLIGDTRSRSKWPWMWKWFPLIIFKTIHHNVFIFHM